MMTAAELRGGNNPSLNDALGWIGSRVDDIYGAAVGRLEDVWIDPGTGSPRWLLVKEGRFGGRSTLIPFEDAVAGVDHVWVPYERDVIREAPQIEPGVPLTQQVEATLRNHYAVNAAAAVSHGTRAARAEGPPEAAEPGVSRATIRPVGEEPPEAAAVPPPSLPGRPPPPVDAPRPEEGPPAFAAQVPQRPQPFAPQQEPYRPAPEQPYQPPQAHPPPAYEPSAAAHPHQPPQPPPDPLGAVSEVPAGHMVVIELKGNVTITGELSQIRIVPPGESGHRN